MIKVLVRLSFLAALCMAVTVGIGCARSGGGGGGTGDANDGTTGGDGDTVGDGGDTTGGGGDTTDGGGGTTGGGGDTTGGDGTTDGGTTDGDGGTTDGGDTTGDGDALIKTRIVMDVNTLIMRPKAGDDLIVWGDRETVYYIVPSQTDGSVTAGTEFPEGPRFAWTHFAVSGKKVALVTDLGEVRVFDTGTGDFRDFPANEILLEDSRLNDDTMAGMTQSSGNLFATLNDTNQVADGNAVKVIDVTGDDPNGWEVLSFAVPEEDRTGISQVAVDAQSRRVAAHDDFGQLWVWSLDDPAAAPQQIDMGLSSDLCCMNDGVQMRFEAGLILYQQDPREFPLGLGTTNAALLDVSAATSTLFDNNPTQDDFPVKLAGGSFGYVQWREAGDAQMGPSYRTAIGQVTGAPTSTLASQFDAYPLRPTTVDLGVISQEQCFGDELKLVGYGSSMCITPDGGRWFVAGWGPIDRTWDYLQMSTGGAFVDFADPEGSTTTGSVMATDVSCSSNVVAFRALRETPDSNCLTNEEWVVGFILLDRLN